MDNQVGFVSTSLRGRRCTVPRWVFLEWEQGGLKSLISEFGLERSYDNPVEEEVMRNMTRFSFALRRFYQMFNGVRANLTKLERQLLDTERRVMNEMPHRQGHEVHVEIAKRMSNKKSAYTPAQVKAMLEDVSQRLIDLQAIVDQRDSFEKVIKKWRKDWEQFSGEHATESISDIA